MHYLRIYVNLCRKAKKRKIPVDKEKYENHHVFPQSIYGKNDNIVILTLREHYVSHLLLWKYFRKRYGPQDYRTRKMAQAYHMMVYGNGGDNHRTENYTSKQFLLAKMAMYEAKKGKVRMDMIGKKYFGASEESIKLGIEKMRNKKIGMKMKNYPKNRKSRPCPTETSEKISISRLKTREKYIKMTEIEFSNWIEKQNLFRKDGRKNPNVTRALVYRKKDVGLYYSEIEK